MTRDPEPPEEDPRKQTPSPKEEADPATKALRLNKERAELVAALDSADFTTMKTRVAAILNLHRESRNSDVTLALKYWEIFQPEIYNAAGIHPRDLFKLERFHLIVRVRAKIQNEYGLFPADEGIRRHRRTREENMQDAVIQDNAPRRLINIFSDETGKTDRYVIVAAVWVLDSHAVFSLTRAVLNWKDQSPWARREVHFARFGKQDPDPLAQYLDVVTANRQFLGFKFAAVERAMVRRPIEEVVAKLHEYMLIEGANHEITSNRIALPRELELTMDEEQSLDPFALSEMKRRVNDAYSIAHGEQLLLAEARTASSRNSVPIQLADVVAGALNRRMNYEGDRNVKDELADLIIDRLGLEIQERALAELDSSAFLLV